MLRVDEHQIEWSSGDSFTATDFICFSQIEDEGLFVTSGDSDGSAHFEIPIEQVPEFLVALQAWIEQLPTNKRGTHAPNS